MKAAWLIAVLLIVWPPVAGAATIDGVDTTDDLAPNSVCSLREAVQIANLNSAAVEDDCNVTGTLDLLDTISLGAGTFTLSLGGASEDTNMTGDLDLGEGLIIDGVGDDALETTIDANSIDRALDVSNGANRNVTVQDLTIANGSPPPGEDGGAIRWEDDDDDLSLLRATIRDSDATDYGGGLAFEGTGDPKLTITETEFVGNITAEHGGAVYYDAPGTGSTPAEAIRSTFAGNISGGRGGAIYIKGEPATSVGMILRNSTLTGNSAAGGGGALAIGFGPGEADIYFSTIASNTSSTAGTGGGIQIGDEATHAIQLNQSIIANNTAAGTAVNCARTGGAFAVNSSGYSIDSGNTCDFDPMANDLINTNPLLGPLAENSGGTRTMGLYDGSPAIDLIPRNPDQCVQAQGTDQRGIARPAAPLGFCDVGAFEGSLGPAPDTDGDGVVDPADNCPTQAGPASNGGCPLPVVTPVPPLAAPPATVPATKRCKKGQKLKKGKCVKKKRKK